MIIILAKFMELCSLNVTRSCVWKIDSTIFDVAQSDNSKEKLFSPIFDPDNESDQRQNLITFRLCHF